jgi:hypothetical protein
MAYIFVDDSKHHQSGFSLALLVICDCDPSEGMGLTFQKHGFEPRTFEFKSSADMKGNPELQSLRSSLKDFIRENCTLAVCVVKHDARLGSAALEHLKMALTHPHLAGKEHEVYFDEGFFRSVAKANKQIEDEPQLGECKFHFEQDSKEVLGIQLADLAAHTCSTMLNETLGIITKKIVANVPGDDVYHGLEIELGFEMWADLRYAFLGQRKPHPKDEFEFACLDVHPWGLFIDYDVDDQISLAAMERFGEMYLGCIH